MVKIYLCGRRITNFMLECLEIFFGELHKSNELRTMLDHGKLNRGNRFVC